MWKSNNNICNPSFTGLNRKIIVLKIQNMFRRYITRKGLISRKEQDNQQSNAAQRQFMIAGYLSRYLAKYVCLWNFLLMSCSEQDTILFFLYGVPFQELVDHACPQFDIYCSKEHLLLLLLKSFLFCHHWFKHFNYCFRPRFLLSFCHYDVDTSVI